MIYFTVTAATYGKAIEKAIVIAKRFYGEDTSPVVEMTQGRPEVVMMTGEVTLWHCEFRA